MSLLQDLTFAARLIWKDRWFSAIAIAVLALGIGVNATVFTLVNAVLIKGLPFEDSGSLYMLGARTKQQSRGGSLSHPDLIDWRKQIQSFASIAGFTNRTANVSDDSGVPEQVQSTLLTANAFATLGQRPLLGRDFLPQDDQPGAERTVLIGYSLWQRRYGGDVTAVGRSLRIDGEPATIVGVMPEGLRFPTNSDMWMPFIPTPDSAQRENAILAVFGRIGPGVSRAAATTELTALSERLAAEYPAANKDRVVGTVETFNERFNGGEIRQVFLALMGAVGFVLLIACANVANLMLSRAAHRTREVAVRFALGATRWRVVRQLLVESILLGVIGGLFGLIIAIVGVRLFDNAVTDVGKPYWIQFTIDPVVIAFLALVCIVTGVLFGLAPALQVSRTNVNEVLKEGGRGTAGNRRARVLTSTMVVAELALTLVLLVGAGLMTRSFLKLYSFDPGIRAEHLMSMEMRLPSQKYPTPEARREFFDRLAPRLAAIPGADAVAITTSIPPFGSEQRRVEIEGRPEPDAARRQSVGFVATSPEFFDTVGVTLLRGRAFQPSDGAPGAENAIINARFATEYFAGEDPIGRRIRFPVDQPPPDQPPPAWRTIVGISPALRHGSPQDATARATVYVPYRQDPASRPLLLVRSRIEPAAIVDAVRQMVSAIDRDQPVFTVRTHQEMMARNTWQYKVFGSLFALFALIALLISSVGLYGVVAYSVTTRTQEIGVRMALGASAPAVRWLVLRRGLWEVGIGLALGLTGAYLIAGVLPALSALLVQVEPTDTVTFIAVPLVLTAVAVAACLIPAGRATRLNPLIALRKD